MLNLCFLVQVVERGYAHVNVWLNHGLEICHPVRITGFDWVRFVSLEPNFCLDKDTVNKVLSEALAATSKAITSGAKRSSEEEVGEVEEYVLKAKGVLCSKSSVLEQHCRPVRLHGRSRPHLGSWVRTPMLARPGFFWGRCLLVKDLVCQTGSHCAFTHATTCARPNW